MSYFRRVRCSRQKMRISLFDDRCCHPLQPAIVTSQALFSIENKLVLYVYSITLEQAVKRVERRVLSRVRS